MSFVFVARGSRNVGSPCPESQILHFVSAIVFLFSRGIFGLFPLPDLAPAELL